MAQCPLIDGTRMAHILLTHRAHMVLAGLMHCSDMVYARFIYGAIAAQHWCVGRP